MKEIGETDKRLYGEYAVLYVGFSKDEREKLKNFSKSHSEGLKVVFACKDDMDVLLKEVFKRDDGSCFEEDADFPKTVIMSGFTEKELLEFLKELKTLDIKYELAAVLTKFSKDWKLKDLVGELIKEREELARRNRKG